MAQAEARVLRGSLDCVGQERDKLRQDLQDCNLRSQLLAQEIDEQQARQEREGREQVQVSSFIMLECMLGSPLQCYLSTEH